MPTPKTLIAIESCRRFRDRVQAQLSTWVPEVLGADVQVFVGKGKDKPLPRETVLECGDDYDSLPNKTQAIVRWALKKGYKRVLKVDDDIYFDASRLNELLKTDTSNYSGRVRGASGGRPAAYCSGFAYFLSERSMRVLAEARVDDKCEDRWVGNALYIEGVSPVHFKDFVIAHSTKNAISGQEGPRVGNSVVAVGELSPLQMLHEHDSIGLQATYECVERPPGDFSSIDVMVKTFLRDGHMERTVAEIERIMPSARIVLVDDGHNSKVKVKLYSQMIDRGHSVTWMPFDSGFCAKSNMAVMQSQRPYLLIACDDFTFDGVTARSVLKMQEVLEFDGQIGVASGRVNNIPYDGYLTRHNDVITELPLREGPWLKTDSGVEYQLCDITVNWSLCRREVFWEGDKRTKVIWDERYKIGADHFEFFDQVARDDWDVAILRDAPVVPRPNSHGLSSPDYGYYRGRAYSTLPLFFEKYKLKKYVSFSGRADVLLPNGQVVSDAKEEKMALVNSSSGLSNPLAGRKRGKLWVSPERLWTLPDGRVVNKEYKGSKSLLVTKGGTLPLEQALRLGLTVQEA